MKRSSSAFVLLSIAVLLGCQKANSVPADQVEGALGEYSTIYEAGVRVRVPDGFEEREFAGFRHPENGCLIMARSVPHAYTDDYVNHAKSLKEGKILERKAVRIDGMRGTLLHHQKPPDENDPDKSLFEWSLVFGNSESTKMVFGSYFKNSPPEFRDILRAAVLSARFDESPPPKPGERQSFTLSPSNKLKVVDKVWKDFIFTEDGEVPTKSASAPIFIAGNFKLPTKPVLDKRSFAETSLKREPGVTRFEIYSVNEVILDGISGYELEANGIHEKTSKPAKVYYVVLFDAKEYVMITGYCGEDVSEQYLPEFKEMAASFQRKKK